MLCPVWICHARSLRFSQAVQQRGLHLANIGQRYLGAQFDFVLRAVPDTGGAGPWCDDLEGGVVWLSAGMGGRMPEAELAELKRRNRAVIVDWMEQVPVGPGIEHVDRHVFSSLTAYRMARRRYPDAPLSYVTATPDRRLGAGHIAPQDAFAPLFPGNPKDLGMRPRLAKRLTAAAPDEGFTDVVPRLRHYNCHVVVADTDSTHAPLTGVFSAAAVRAVALVDRTRADAIDYLGKDYPFLSEDGSDDALTEMLAYAAHVFGTSVWQAALERMHNMRDRSSPGMVASDLDRVLEETTGIRFGHSSAA